MTMTTDKKIELAQLEMRYLDAVRNNDTSEQIEAMELIYYWVRKLVWAASSDVDKLLSLDQVEMPQLTGQQKGEFAHLQMLMLSFVSKGDKIGMTDTERAMQDWVDHQVSAAEGKEVKKGTKLKIVL
jgi:hypothetical protein